MRIPKAELIYKAQMAIANEAIEQNKACVAHPYGKDRLVFMFIRNDGQLGSFWLYKKDALVEKLNLAGVLSK